MSYASAINAASSQQYYIVFGPGSEERRKIYKQELHESDWRISESHFSTIRRITKESIINKIKISGIEINNERLLHNLLDKLEEEEIVLLDKIMDYLKHKKYKFSIEVYEGDGDLELLYFVIHFPSTTDYKERREKILELIEYKLNIDEKKLLWFVSFTH